MKMNIEEKKDSFLKTNLKLDDMSRNIYLFLPVYLIKASSFLRTIRSQMTTSFLILNRNRLSKELQKNGTRTPCPFSYSASRYKNNCFVFQWKSGVKSVHLSMKVDHNDSAYPLKC